MRISNPSKRLPKRITIDVEISAKYPLKNLTSKARSESFVSGNLLCGLGEFGTLGVEWRQIASPGVSIQIRVGRKWQTVNVYCNPAKDAEAWQRGLVWTARHIQACLTYSTFSLIPAFPNEFEEPIPIQMPNQKIEFRTRLKISISQGELDDMLILRQHILQTQC